MKTVFIALLATLCLGSHAVAEDLLKPSTTPPPVDDVAAGNSLEAEQAHQANGVIRAIDLQQGSVTIAHGPVPELKWPAMIMPFKADAAQLGGLAVGDAVEFGFTDGEMDPQIVFIRRQ
ncbi:copper-binding protein [Pseudomonas songnenensis]|jgi:Cu/Ag efflux protein CusF|uniref:Copper-binding protein n=1 Tax=Pseudomonas songnenensis TaxID=1176259 RepID=A0A482U7E4_9PSED|nr:copper-binding protein [Pseudomonas songnenensis]AWM59104.1 copper-binding protein [Stutzerimonas stutzeri]RYJ62445.1 copper-binding protein [Pseudomonas songnenensis]